MTAPTAPPRQTIAALNVSGPDWLRACRELADRFPHYQLHRGRGPERHATGLPDMGHIQGAAFKLGYKEITDTNRTEAIQAITKRAQELYPPTPTQETDMKRSEAFPTKFLSKDDIHAPTVGVIEKVVNETLGQGEDQEIKPVMYFKSGIPKPMVINNTNWINVEGVYGDESDGWAGKPIEVWVDPSVSFGGKRIGGLRLRAPASNGHAPQPELSQEQALQALADAGVDKETFKQALIEDHGKATYAPSRDSALVYRLIEQNRQPEPEIEL